MTSKQRALPNQDAYLPATTLGRWRVTKPSRIPVVLIVDEDLGFVWWLGQIFSQAGCQVVPTLNAEQMVSLTQDLNLKVDLIVVNPELSGIPEMIRALSTSRLPKIVAIRNHDTGVGSTLHADATLERPSGWGPVSEKEWLGCVRGLVRDIRFSDVERAACS